MRTIGRLTSGVLLFAIGVSAGCASAGTDGPSPSLELVEQGSLVVCAEIPYAPFVAEDEDGDPTGFEIELLEGMADDLELDLVVRQTPYAAIDDGDALRRGRCDLAAGALTVTERRRQSMSFVEPHYDVSLTLLVPSASDIGGLADLSGRRLAVEEDTSAATYARNNAPADAIIEPLAGDQDMIEALREGRVDGVLQEQPVNLVHTQSGRFATVEQHRTGEQYAFAVRRNAEQLRRALDDRLQQLRADGTYLTLYEEYLAQE